MLLFLDFLIPHSDVCSDFGDTVSIIVVLQ